MSRCTNETLYYLWSSKIIYFLCYIYSRRGLTTIRSRIKFFFFASRESLTLSRYNFFLWLIQSDLMGLTQTLSFIDSRYMLIFIDGFTSFT